MSPASHGIAQTQVTSGAAGGAGAILLNAPQVVGVATPVNLSTEGALDWYCKAGFGGLNDNNVDTASTEHWKLRGGFIRNLFHWFGPSATYAGAAGGASPKFTFTSILGDDACLGSAMNANFLNSVAITGPVLSANTNTQYSNWGFRVGAYAGKGLRRLKVYFRFSPSGVVAANSALQITAHLEDGSAADVTVTLQPITVGFKEYTIQTQFQAASEVVPFLLTFNVIEAVGDNSIQIGFYAATSF